MACPRGPPEASCRQVDAKYYEMILQRARNAEATGRWWDPPWWRVPGALPDDVEADEFEAAVTVVRRVFDEAWFLDSRATHPLVTSLMNSGINGVRETLLAAALLSAIADADGEPAAVDDLARRLRDRAEYRGARREAFVAALLRAAGLRYRFVTSQRGGPPKPDLKTLTGDPRFCVEVTGIDFRDADRRIQIFISSAGRVLGRALEPYGYEAVLDGERVAACACAETLASESAVVLDDIERACSNGRPVPGTRIDMDGIGTVAVVNTPGGQVQGPEINTRRMAEKAASVIIGKKRQLPRDRPGVVVVEFPYALVQPWEVTDALLAKFGADREATKHVAGAVLMTAWHSTTDLNTGAIAVENPFAKVPLTALPWSAIRSASE